MRLSLCKNTNCKYVVLPAGNCCHCNQDNFEPVGREQLHERVRLAYGDARNLITNREFDRALVLLDFVRQWSPTESGVYFYRLLARTGSTFEGELLMHGFRSGENSADEQCDPDFLLAKKYAANDDEQMFYEMLIRANNEICAELTKRESTAFETELTEMQEQIRSRAPEISKMQEELQQLQQELMELMLACTDAENELSYAVNVQKVAEAMLTMKHFKDIPFELQNVVDEKTMNTGTVHAYYMRMAAAADMYQNAKNAAEMIAKEHPWRAVIEEMKKKQAELEAQIAVKQEQIRRSDNDLVEMQERYQMLQESYASTMKALHAYRFRDALYHENENALQLLVYQKSGIQRRYLQRGNA